MPGELDSFLQQAARTGFGLGYDLGDDDVGDDEMGYDIGDDDVGAIHRRKRARAKAIARARHIDKFDRVYGSAAREAGSALPEMAVGYSAQALATGVTFTFTFNAPQACILTGLNMNAAAAGVITLGNQLFDCQLSISGQPVGGYPKFGPSRFQANSMNRRLEPVEVDTSVPITFTATTAVTGGGTLLFEVEVMATRIVSGLKFASR